MNGILAGSRMGSFNSLSILHKYTCALVVTRNVELLANELVDVGVYGHG